MPGIGQIAKILVNNMAAPAGAGDMDSHSGLGALINIIPHNVMLGGMVPAIPSIASMAAPDIIGMIPHLQGMPIPMQGAKDVFIGMGAMGGGGITSMLGQLGQMGGGFGSILGGNLNIGELVSMGQSVVGQVMSFNTNTGGNAGSVNVQLSNMQGPIVPPGATLTGQTTGNSVTFGPFIDSRVPGITTMGAGLGAMQPIIAYSWFGPFIAGYYSLTIGEYVSAGGVTVGQVQDFIPIGGGGAVSMIGTLSGNTLTPGTVITGQTSGHTFTYFNFFDSRTSYANAVRDAQAKLDAAAAINPSFNNDMSSYTGVTSGVPEIGRAHV